MIAQQLWFSEPYKLEIREHSLGNLKSGELQVRNLYSAISSGTELLVYRGQLPDTLALDQNITALAEQAATYPLQYGYACVGVVEAIGPDVEAAWQGKTVFSFQPHVSQFVSQAQDLILVPEDIDPQAALFLANMETAVNLIHDGNPRLGERVAVIGQGIVGLLVSRLLADFPLASLFAIETIDSRRALAQQAGVKHTCDPTSGSDLEAIREKLDMQSDKGGADLVIEVSGAPDALNLAIDFCGFGSRIVLGSWYGSKRAEINLGERFHRQRIQIISSQVSTIAPELSGRWNKSRRFDLAWDRIRQCQPEQFITHRLPLSEAAEAYHLLDQSPQQALQIVFDFQA